MPSKEECKRALEYLQNPTDIESKWYSVDILNEVIDEHFKLVEIVYKLETQKERLINEYTEEHQLADEHKFNEFILEKALDKACNMLYEYNDILSQEKWKDWCIEDVK